MGGLLGGGGGGGGGKGYIAPPPPSPIIGEAGPPWPPSSYAYEKSTTSSFRNVYDAISER